MKKLIIFDLDETLVYLDFETMNCHDNFLNMLKVDLSKKSEIINEMMIFFKAFNQHFKDKIVTMEETKDFMLSVCPFISKYNLSIDNVIKSLFDATIEATKAILGARETLTYLKEKGYQMVIITNWFEYVQLGKLELTNLLEYFSKIICIDNNYLKPNINVLANILENFQENECVIIGNNYDEDVELGTRIGIDTIWINHKNKSIENNQATYTIIELEELRNIL